MAPKEPPKPSNTNTEDEKAAARNAARAARPGAVSVPAANATTTTPGASGESAASLLDQRIAEKTRAANSTTIGVAAAAAAASRPGAVSSGDDSKVAAKMRSSGSGSGNSLQPNAAGVQQLKGMEDSIQAKIQSHNSSVGAATAASGNLKAAPMSSVEAADAEAKQRARYSGSAGPGSGSATSSAPGVVMERLDSRIDGKLRGGGDRDPPTSSVASTSSTSTSRPGSFVSEQLDTKIAAKMSAGTGSGSGSAASSATTLGGGVMSSGSAGVVMADDQSSGMAEISPPTDVAVKNMARYNNNGQPSLPGAYGASAIAAVAAREQQKMDSAKQNVASSAATRDLEDRITSKIHTHNATSSNTTTTTTAANDALAKQRASAAVASHVVGPDAKISSKLASGSAAAHNAMQDLRDVETSIQAKIASEQQRGGSGSVGAEAASNSNDDKLAKAKANANTGAAVMSLQDLRTFETNVQSKIGASTSTGITATKTAAPESLSNFHDQISNKMGAAGGGEGQGVEVTRERIPLDLYDIEESVLHKTRMANVVDTNNNSVHAKNNAGSAADAKLQSGLYRGDESEHGGLGTDDPNGVEFGEYGGPEESGLAVAFAVEEDEDVYIPSAVEYDPDAKPPLYRNRRFRLYACLLLVAVALGTIGAVAGIVITRGSGTPPALPDRATFGIREYVERFIGSGEPLSNPTHPYSKALDWIQNLDVMALTPESKKFTQRFLTAYMYFMTSMENAWGSECAPSTDEDQDCVLRYTNVLDPGAIFTRDAFKWLSPEDECVWAGVECDGFGQIVKIDLNSINMTGSFPDGLVGVPYLQFLCLSIGQLKGPVPSAVGDMKHMMNVELGENFFQGTIPESWYDLRVLQKITLARNLITGTISSQVGRWKEMKAFYLNENDITGSIPAELFDMKSITFTWLDGNNIGGTIPTQIGNWKRAHEISFHRNQLTGPIPSTIGGLSSVMLFLRLHANMLNSSIPAEIQLMDNLRTLELTDNQLTGSLLPLTNMTKLETLLIENNKFSGLLPRELAQLKRLGLFYASGNDLDGPVPQRVCNLLAVDDAQGSTKSLKEFQLDCAVQLDGTVEIDCPCCTHCCDPDGTNCKEVVKT